MKKIIIVFILSILLLNVVTASLKTMEVSFTNRDDFLSKNNLAILDNEIKIVVNDPSYTGFFCHDLVFFIETNAEEPCSEYVHYLFSEYTPSGGNNTHTVCITKLKNIYDKLIYDTYSNQILCNSYQLMNVEWELIFSSGNEFDDFLGNRKLNFKLIGDDEYKKLKDVRRDKIRNAIISFIIGIGGFIVAIIEFPKKKKNKINWIAFIISLTISVILISFSIWQMLSLL